VPGYAREIYLIRMNNEIRLEIVWHMYYKSHSQLSIELAISGITFWNVFLHGKGQLLGDFTGKYGSKLLFIPSNHGENETSLQRSEMHMVHMKQAKNLDSDSRRWGLHNSWNSIYQPQGILCSPLGCTVWTQNMDPSDLKNYPKPKIY
jgi:hypothetical protein